MPRIGELLVAEGAVSELAVQSALGFQRHTGEPFRLGTILLDRDLLGEDILLRALSKIHRCDAATWADILKAPPDVVRALPERIAVRLAAIPYAVEGRGLRVAFKNPSNLAAVDEVSAVSGRPVIPAVISEVRLLQALHLFYGRPIPIEFRGVLHKLERGEERRLYRSRATVRPNGASAPPAETPQTPSAPPRPEPPLGREIPISVGPAAEPAPRPRFAAPFSTAEQPAEPHDDVDLLPEFAPPLPFTPEDLAAGMWKEEQEAAALVAASRPRALEPLPASVDDVRPMRPAALEPREPARDRLAESTLDALTQRFPRAMLLVSGQDAIQGWTARGAGLTRDRISSVRVPWGDPSIFAFVKLSGTPHRGGLSRVLMPPVLAALLGPRAAASCAVFPVRIKDRLVAFLYADRLGAPLTEEDHRALEVASSSLGSSLARLLLDLRRAAPAT
ncbi:MAG TPA: hypothetical protein VH854_05180 [Thermoanaerobaculia bacterium]|nr:hypothetical protein [Thermoanaerobaculia bacterium]